MAKEDFSIYARSKKQESREGEEKRRMRKGRTSKKERERRIR
jgi:hypothetical protein